MSETAATIAMFNTHVEAEEAVRELQRAGFDMKKLSIVGKGYHSEEQVMGFYNVGDRMKYWGTLGAFWGALWGFLVGAAFFWVPGIGPLVVGGPLVSWIVGALEGATITGGLTVLGAALYSIGIPKDSILQYETLLKADKFMIMLHGTGEEALKAHDILAQSNAIESSVHHHEVSV